MVAPVLAHSPHVEFIGEIDDSRKQEFLGKAYTFGSAPANPKACSILDKEVANYCTDYHVTDPAYFAEQVARTGRDLGEGLRVETLDWPLIVMEFPEQRIADIAERLSTVEHVDHLRGVGGDGRRAGRGTPPRAS